MIPLAKQRAVRLILNTPKKVKYFSKNEALNIILWFSDDCVKGRRNLCVDIDLIGADMQGVTGGMCETSGECSLC